jgi:RND family efflux transporter MFP subunit
LLWIAALPALLVVSAGCDRKTPAQPEKGSAAAGAGAVKDVQLSPVRREEIERTVSISGTLAADEQVTVSAEVAGRLASIAVDMASPVQKGQVVAHIENSDYRLRVEQAAAAVAQARAELGLPADGKSDEVDVESTALVRQARATYDEAQAAAARMRKLTEEGLSTGMELEAAEAAAVRAETGLQTAREQVQIRRATIRQRRSEQRLAEQQLADATIRSPIDGVVQLRHVTTGAYLAAGAAVVDIVRIDPLRLRVALPEREATGIQQGQTVRVTVDGDKSTYTGTVARLAPAIDPRSRSLLVEADIKNPGNLRPGSFAHARIVTGKTPALTVPASAIVQFAGLQKVVTIENGKAVEKRVTLGKTRDERAEVVSGLTLGESVVTRPGSLQHGQRVRAVPGS